MDKKWCSGPMHPPMWKPLSAFYRNRSRDDGYQVECKECSDWRISDRRKRHAERTGAEFTGEPGAAERLERWIKSDDAAKRLEEFCKEMRK